MERFYLFLVCYISFVLIQSEYSSYAANLPTNCDNYWLQINETCDNYFTPTIAIQTLSQHYTNSLESYSRISLSIKANHDVIITPHCISMDIAINPAIMKYLSHEWLSNNVEWPQYHSMGDIITFSDKEISSYITFASPCIIGPNTTAALILLFNTDFDGYWIETQCKMTDNSATISIYDTIYDDSCSKSISSSSLWNLRIMNESIEESNAQTQIIYQYINSDSSNDNLILSLIILIVLLNICCCGLLWYFNQKQFHKNIIEISKTVQEMNDNKTEQEMNDNNDDISCVATANSASASTSSSSVAPSPSHVSSAQILKEIKRNGIVWVNKSYFDSNSNDNHNLFTYNNSVSPVSVSDNNDDAQSPKHKLDKLRIVLPPKSKSMHLRSNPSSETILSAMTLSAEDFLSPNNMDPIHEDQETPITKPNQRHCRRSKSNDSLFSVASSIRLPAYHPNNIKVLTDNKHIPYNKTFIIAVTPPIRNEANTRNKLNVKKEMSLALPQTNQTNTLHR